MGLTERLGVAIYNAGVRRRNKFVKGEYHVGHKLVKGAKVGAAYINAVGTNIVNDVSTGQSQMFPFQNPTQQPRRKKRKRQTYNPYPLI